MSLLGTARTRAAGRRRTDRIADRSRRGTARRLGRHLTAFRREEDGTLIIFSLFIFVLMLMICGLALDLMRYETARSKLQATVDRAVLAAASLDQDLDAQTVVDDYFLKAGMQDFLGDVTVQEGFNYREVTVSSSVDIDTHFFSMAGIETLTAPGNGAARESIGNVEISLVLDISGSMNNHNRLFNLKNAAEDFIDTVYGSAEDDTVSTSIIPYATQVSASPELAQHYNFGTEAHDHSYCVNFEANDFTTTSISHTDALEQTLHFDPWYTASYLIRPVCPDEPGRQIKPWSTNPEDLKDYVDDLTADGNTSTEIGLKWGLALLDPASRPVLSAMIQDGDVDTAMEGRPFNFNSTDSMKIIVVMTDGDNTSQFYMRDAYRSGLTDTFMYVNGAGTRFFSVWNGSGEPEFDQETGWYCEWRYWNGACGDWEYSEGDWYIPHLDSWSGSPHGGDDARRLTWPEVWAEVTMTYHAYYHIYPTDWNANEYYEITGADRTVSSGEKNNRMADICQTAHNAGIIVFSIGLEVSNASATRLENCASSPAHFFLVEGLDIAYAFQAIAGEINQLRLIQ